jgi:hypothetical protein
VILPLGLALTLASGIAPATARWATDQERRILSEGQPLGHEGLAFARELDITEPETIRVLEVKSVPLPAPRPLVRLAGRWGFPVFEPAGMALGRGIYLLDGQSRILRHELVHVAQYQRLGGIEPFLRQYLTECLVHGYLDSPLEVEAREKE